MSLQTLKTSICKWTQSQLRCKTNMFKTSKDDSMNLLFSKWLETVLKIDQLAP